MVGISLLSHRNEFASTWFLLHMFLCLCGNSQKLRTKMASAARVLHRIGGPSILATFVVLTICSKTFAAKDTCVTGKYHRKTPGNEGKAFAECQPWKPLSCCTAALTVELAKHQTRNLYNHTWHRCKKLSKSCERYWINQECFYQCSPYISKWQDSSYKEAVKAVPICSSVCNQWYEACKTDEICVENVIEDYNFTEHGENFCPRDKPCITYQKMYGSGKALCEKMWGTSYKYVEENSESSNCMVMWFSGKNPNKLVKPKNKSPNAGARVYGKTIFIIFFITALSLQL